MCLHVPPGVHIPPFENHCSIVPHTESLINSVMYGATLKSSHHLLSSGTSLVQHGIKVLRFSSLPARHSRCFPLTCLTSSISRPPPDASDLLTSCRIRAPARGCFQSSPLSLPQIQKGRKKLNNQSPHFEKLYKSAVIML